MSFQELIKIVFPCLFVDKHEENPEEELEAIEEPSLFESSLWMCENATIDQLKAHTQECFKTIPVNKYSTIPSLSHGIIMHLYAVSTEDEIRNSFDRVLNIIRAQTSSISSRTKRLCALRTIIKQRFGDNDMYQQHKRLHINEININDKEIRINKKIAFNPNDIAMLVESCINSDNVYDQIIAVQLVSGLSFEDICIGVKIREHPDRDDIVVVEDEKNQLHETQLAGMGFSDFVFLYENCRDGLMNMKNFLDMDITEIMKSHIYLNYREHLLDYKIKNLKPDILPEISKKMK